MTRRDVYVRLTAVGYLMNRYAVSVWLNRSEDTIRRYCTVHGYLPDGRALYVADECEAALADADHRRGRDGQTLTTTRR